MTRDEVLRLAREAGFDSNEDGFYLLGSSAFVANAGDIERFAALVAAAERIKHQSEIQRLTALANTAEKWRGIAMARDGDGRTVQQVQAEARADEREACAKVCDELVNPSRISDPGRSWITGTNDCAAAIRARGRHA